MRASFVFRVGELESKPICCVFACSHACPFLLPLVGSFGEVYAGEDLMTSEVCLS